MNLFPESANTVLWLVLGGGGALLAGAPVALIGWARTPYATGTGAEVSQPVKFDHRHHVRDDGIDCLYCHGDATRSRTAGVPATSVCMGCHAQVWTESPELALVRASAATGAPIHWRRVTAVPDFVYFDHSVHVTKGIGCVSCHGRVDQMAEVYAAQPLTMRWCLDCHRAPDQHLRPLDRITDMEWEPPPAKPELGRELRAQLGVRSVDHCTACHR